MSTRPVAPVTFLAPEPANARPASDIVSDYVDGMGSRVVRYRDGSSITSNRHGNLIRGGHRSAAGRADAARARGLRRVEVKGETAKMWAFGASAGARFTRG